MINLSSKLNKRKCIELNIEINWKWEKGDFITVIGLYH